MGHSNGRTGRGRLGFTLVEVCATVAALSGVVTMVGVVALPHSRDMANRTRCGANLNGLGKAMVLYNESWRAYMAISKDAGDNRCVGPAEDIWRYNGKPGTFLLDGTADTPVAAVDAMNLLVRDNLVPWAIFRCPSVSREIATRDGKELTYGFMVKNELYIDYAAQWWGNDGKNKAYPSDQTDAAVIIVADRHGKVFADDFGPKNDGTGFNHGAAGVNALAASLSNAFWKNNSFAAGWGGNNIYICDVNESGVIEEGKMRTVAVPVHENDSVLVNPK